VGIASRSSHRVRRQGNPAVTAPARRYGYTTFLDALTATPFVAEHAAPATRLGPRLPSPRPIAVRPALIVTGKVGVARLSGQRFAVVRC
jgi:hypothetical protein